MMIFKSNNGFSLVEVIISIAIIGILLLTFLSIFINNSINIFSAGEITESVFEAQNKIDKTIKEINCSTDDEKIIVVPIDLDIKFISSDGEENTMEVSGKKVTVEIKGKMPSTLTTYIPK